jgi:uncharacterized membrane protein YgdD (TMEM256/DUF423 family)
MISRMSMLAGSLFAGTAVLLGAFGAHGLKARIAADQLQSFETGVRYQLFHALALLILGLLVGKLDQPALRYAAYCFIFGTVLFSGSIYLLSTHEITGLSLWKPVLGPITPIGGTLLIAGWGFLTYAFYRATQI